MVGENVFFFFCLVCFNVRNLRFQANVSIKKEKRKKKENFERRYHVEYFLPIVLMGHTQEAELKTTDNLSENPQNFTIALWIENVKMW